MATLEIKLLDKLKYNLKNVTKLTDEDFGKRMEILLQIKLNTI